MGIKIEDDLPAATTIGKGIQCDPGQNLTYTWISNSKKSPRVAAGW